MLYYMFWTIVPRTQDSLSWIEGNNSSLRREFVCLLMPFFWIFIPNSICVLGHILAVDPTNHPSLITWKPVINQFYQEWLTCNKYPTWFLNQLWKTNDHLTQCSRIIFMEKLRLAQGSNQPPLDYLSDALPIDLSKRITAEGH
jgi:hypothetical protein